MSALKKYISTTTAVVWIPILFSFLYAFICFLFTEWNQHLLTTHVQNELEANPTQVFWVSLLILLPNLILSLIMYIYSISSSHLGKLLYIPCLSAILGGVIPVLFVYHFFYSRAQTSLTAVPVLSYGFPFVYFLGMCVGWLLGILIAASFAEEE